MSWLEQGGQESCDPPLRCLEKEILKHRHVQATGVIWLFCEEQSCLGDLEEQDRAFWWAPPGASWLKLIQGQKIPEPPRAGTYIGEAGGGVA